MMIDLHMHSIHSDGTDSVAELVRKVKESGITCFSLTDHDTIDGTREAFELAAREGLKFIRGIELSALIDTTDSHSGAHILGFGYDPQNADFLAAIERNIQLRKEKMNSLLRYLETFGIEFDDAAKARLYSQNNAGKPHVARELAAAGVCTFQDAFRLYLNSFHSTFRISAEEAIRAIHAAGGTAVWAHPLKDTEELERHRKPEDFLPQFEKMREFGIDGLECLYSRYTNEEIGFLISQAKAYGLLITAGSDYHGKNKNVVLGQKNRMNERNPEREALISIPF